MYGARLVSKERTLGNDFLVNLVTSGIAFHTLTWKFMKHFSILANTC